MKRSRFFGTFVGLGLLLGAMSGSIAGEMPANTLPANTLPANTLPANTLPADTAESAHRRIDQPLSNKVAATLGGIGLMGLELWWFLLSKPKSQRATAQSGVQAKCAEAERN